MITLDDYIHAHFGEWTLAELEYISSDLEIPIGKILKKFLSSRVVKYRDPFYASIQKEYILKYHKTFTTEQIAGVFGVDKVRINRLCRRLHLSALFIKAKKDDEQKKIVLENYAKKTIRELSELLGVKENRTREILRRMKLTGFETRSFKREYNKKFILDNYKTKTKQQIAKSLNITVTRIEQLCRKLHVTPVITPTKTIRLEFVKENRTKPFLELRKELNVSAQVLSSLFRTLKIKPLTEREDKRNKKINYIKDNCRTKTRNELAKALGLSKERINALCGIAGVRPITVNQQKFLKHKKYLLSHPWQSHKRAAKALGLSISGIERLWMKIRKIEKKKKDREAKINERLALMKNIPKKNAPGEVGSQIVREIKRSNHHDKTTLDLIKLGSKLKFNFGVDSGLLFSEKKKK